MLLIIKEVLVKILIKDSNIYYCTPNYLFASGEELCYIFLTRNNCCELLASDGVMLQSDQQSYFKTSVCDVTMKHHKLAFSKMIE